MAQLILEYDREGDILEASTDEYTATIAQDIGDDVWLKVDVLKGVPRGFIILNLAKRKQPIRLPVVLQGIEIQGIVYDKPGQEWLVKPSVSVS